MPIDLARLRYLLRPTGFLQTREQLEETQHLVDALIKEVEELREYIEDVRNEAMDRDFAE
jgi:hypothetical protein